MSKEQQSLATDGFSFTEREQLYDRIAHERLLSLLSDEATTIHEIDLSTNNYGEFFFVTASRPKAANRELITFWGLDYMSAGNAICWMNGSGMTPIQHQNA